MVICIQNRLHACCIRCNCTNVSAVNSFHTALIRLLQLKLTRLVAITLNIYTPVFVSVFSTPFNRKIYLRQDKMNFESLVLLNMYKQYNSNGRSLLHHFE